MNGLEDIVDRAIDYTNRVLRTMPGYREAAVASLRKLRDGLSRTAPGHPALQRLNDYLHSLLGRPDDPE